MNSIVFDKIIQLNKDFYSDISQNFSNTRQYPWKGWSRVVDEIESKYSDTKKITVADLGCGNGRFYKYLIDRLPDWKIDYTGYDSDSGLLEIAQKSLPTVNFIKLDVIKNLESIDKKFDVVVAFGLTHHIPSAEYRKKWFKELNLLAKPDGLVVFTNWNYDKDKRFNSAVKSIDSISEKELEEGDYFFGWDKQENVYRYVHIYSEIEMNTLLNGLVYETFDSDGRSGGLNRYYIIESF